MPVASGGFETGELIGEGLACRRGERLLLRGLDLRVGPGEALLLTGPNGSGKSSLLRLLATLLPPTAGQLLWNGEPVADEPARYRAALHYVGHLDAVKPALAVHEMLACWTALRPPPTANPAPAANLDAALAAFGLEAQGDWPCRWLSAGQRRRLALARLLAAPAPVWLLDEPAAALDHDGEQRLVSAIAGHRAAGGCAVLAVHQALDVPNAATLSLADFPPGPGAAPEPLLDMVDSWITGQPG